jgi:hypothetical protein
MHGPASFVSLHEAASLWSANISCKKNFGVMLNINNITSNTAKAFDMILYSFNFVTLLQKYGFTFN